MNCKFFPQTLRLALLGSIVWPLVWVEAEDSQSLSKKTEADVTRPVEVV